MSRRRRSRRDNHAKVPHPPIEIHRDRTTRTVIPAQVKNTEPTVASRDRNTGTGAASVIGSKQLLGVALWQAGLLLMLMLLFFLLYLKTAARSMPPGDSGELIAAARILGVAHPPGYPTFTILGHIAGLLPIGTPAFRVNLLSAILDTLALGILEFGVLRFLRAKSSEPNNAKDPLILVAGVVIGIGLLAVSTAYWRYSLVAEVFALNNFFAAIVIVLMLEWVQQPSRRWFLWLSCLFSGIALTDQLTFILLAPGLIFLFVYGLLRWRKQSFAALPHQSSKLKARNIGWQLPEIGIGIGFIIFGLLPYIYLPIAASTKPILNWGNPSSLNHFWRVVMRADYGTLSFAAGNHHGNQFHQLIYLGRYLYNSFTPFGVLLAILGIVWFVRKRSSEGIGLGLLFLFSGPFFAMFANPVMTSPLDRSVFERFYILPSIPFAIFIAAGGVYLIEGTERLIARLKISLWPHAVVAVGLIATIAIPTTISSLRITNLDMSNNRVAEHYGEDLLATLEPNSLLIIMGGDENYEGAIYAQTVLGYRTDIKVFDASLISNWYLDLQGSQHPDITIPPPRESTSKADWLVALVNANIGQRAVYGIEHPNDKLTQNFDTIEAGFTYQFVKKGEVTDNNALLISESDRFINLHYPEKKYPSEPWERLIADHYGELAFKLACALQQPDPQSNADLVERLYRIAILNAPESSSSYKNLGLLLHENGGPPSEIISLWQKYLELVPKDPEADAMREIITTLQAGSK